jgi:hypothetical protein
MWLGVQSFKPATPRASWLTREGKTFIGSLSAIEGKNTLRIDKSKGERKGLESGKGID